MKFESNVNLDNPLTVFRSLSLALLSTIFFVGVEFIVLLFFDTSNKVFLYDFVGFCIIFDVALFSLILVGHFLYFNFDWIVRRECVFCHKYVYVDEMVALNDRRGWETVFMCNTHRIVEVK